MLFPLFRYLLAMMIVVLPLQGTAAMVMPYGGAMTMAHDMNGMPAIDDAGGDTSAMVAGDHCEHAAKAEVKVVHTKCHASANCCIGASAPPSTHAPLPVQFHSTEEPAAREPAMTGIVPPTLERPPRLA